MEPSIRENQEIKRNPDGTYPKGVSGNPKGRPKNPLKNYVREKFAKMSDSEKEAFLRKIAPIDLWKMGEGNPHQTQDTTTDGEKINDITVRIVDGNSGN